MTNQCKTDACNKTQTQISNIQNEANQFSELQNQINNNYQNTNNLLNHYNTNKTSLAASKLGSYNSNFNDPNSYIPSKYVISESFNKPDYTINDGIKHDLDQLIFQQNSIYALGTIIAATLIIAGIFLAR
jgi:hypothetical protein